MKANGKSSKRSCKCKLAQRKHRKEKGKLKMKINLAGNEEEGGKLKKKVNQLKQSMKSKNKQLGRKQRKSSAKELH